MCSSAENDAEAPDQDSTTDHAPVTKRDIVSDAASAFDKNRRMTRRGKAMEIIKDSGNPGKEEEVNQARRVLNRSDYKYKEIKRQLARRARDKAKDGYMEE